MRRESPNLDGGDDLGDELLIIQGEHILTAVDGALLAAVDGLRRGRRIGVSPTATDFDDDDQTPADLAEAELREGA